MAEDISCVPNDSLGLDKGLWVFLIILTVIIITVALLGNLLILYSSIVRGAVKMESIDLAQIYSNAGCDILLMLLFFIPVLITLIQDRYTLGDGWCTFTAYFIPKSIMVYMLLTNTFGTVLRVWLLDKPSQVRSIFPASRVYWAMFVSAFVAIAPSVIFLAVKGEKADECFMVGKLSCTVIPTSDNKVMKIFWWAYTLCLIALPLFILTVANFYAGRVISRVLKNSRTATKEQKCRVSMMITTICWSFLLSYIPIIVVHVMKLSGWKGEGTGFLLLIPTFFLSIASVSNPFVLYLSNVKFRAYVNGLVRCGDRSLIREDEGRNNDSTRTSSCKIIKQQSKSEMPKL